MRKLISTFALVSVLVACSASETDFQDAAEELAVEIAEEAAPDFTAQASCEEPSSTEVGTTFDCTVTFNDGDTVSAIAEIISDDTVEVTLTP